MPTRVLRKPKKTYFYRIFPVDLPDMKTIKRIRPYRLWTFLRGQALFRSEKVQALYMQGKQQGAPLLRERFAFPWNAFTHPFTLFSETEVHHPLDLFADFIETGILDLAKWNKEEKENKVLKEIRGTIPTTPPFLTFQFHGYVPSYCQIWCMASN